MRVATGRRRYTRKLGLTKALNSVFFFKFMTSGVLGFFFLLCFSQRKKKGKKEKDVYSFQGMACRRG